MNVAFHMAVGLVLLLVQTTLLPRLAVAPAGYDLLVAYTVYLGLRRRASEGLPVILVFGVAVDTLSGGPLGLFLTVYVWLYWIARWVIRFIHPRNRLLSLLAVAFGVAFEHLIYMATTAMLSTGALLPAPTLRAALTQILLALVTGGLLLGLLAYMQRAYEGWLSAFLVREAG